MFGILFDYNGVIVLDEHLQEASTIRAMSDYSVNFTHQNYNDLCLGRSDLEGFQNIKRIFQKDLTDVSPKTLQRTRLRYYQQLLNTETILAPTVTTVLHGLEKFAHLGLVTGSVRSEVFPVLKSNQLILSFKTLIFGDDLENGKPHPEGYLRALTALGTSPKKTVVIEDTLPGIQAAHRANLKCIAVCSTNSPENLSSADHVISNISQLDLELIKYVLSCNKQQILM